MRIIVTLAPDRAIEESLRAALPEYDLVLHCATVDEVVEQLVSTNPDLTIVDEHRGLSPSDFTRIANTRRDVPMVVLSARRDTESLAAFIVSGAKRCLVKPFTCEELLETVDSVCAAPHLAAGHAGAVGNVSAPTPGYVYQHQTALRWMSRHGSQLDDPAEVSRSVVDAMVDIFDTSRAAVLLVKHGTARVVASQGIAEEFAAPLRLDFGRGLMRWLDDNGCLFDRRRNPDQYEAQKELGVLRARLAFPIVVNGQTRGAVVIGEKSNGSDYSIEERELLSIMTRGLATTFERSRQFRDVSRQQHRVDAVLANITTGVVSVRNDKTVSMMNQAAEQLLGARAADILGQSVQRLGSAFADVVLRTLHSKKPCLRQEVFLANKEITLGVSVTPVDDEGVAAIFAAIPGKSKQPEGLQDARFWEYLSSRVAQEIKNPMVAINTFAQLLPSKYDSEGFRDEFASVVQGEVARINAVVEALYAFARPASLHPQPLSLNGEVGRVLASLKAEFAEHAIDLETEYDAADLSINVDPSYFERAVKEVLQNSIDAMRTGGSLQVSTKRNNGWCELVVADSGGGISEQDLPLIFLPFYSTKERGMGLGLTMAERIVGAQDGRLELMETNERGTSFAFRLPPAKSSERPSEPRKQPATYE